MATSDPLSVITALKDALYDLDDEHITNFKLHLRDSTLFEKERKFEVINRSKLEKKSQAEIVEVMLDTYGIFAFEVVKKVLRTMHKNSTADELCECPYDPEEILKACNNSMKSELRERFEFLSEGVSSRTQMEFNDGYTELFITEGDSGRVNEEHEVRQMERDSRKSGLEKTVRCQDIFKGTNQRGKPIRVVLTKGVAGAGKTVLTQKFSLDWAEGRENQAVQLLFHFTFRELNELRDLKFSLVELLHDHFSETKDLFSFNGLQLLLIFDGLDECSTLLNFRRTRGLRDPTESASVEELLVNLIRGNLLPSARLWITTRPAAANQIPAEYVSMVTEVRGFTDEQKEKYFRRRFTDEATKVISHIKTSRSLFIMCHLPVICWIISDVLLHLMETKKTEDLPSTLIEMYVHFLVVQVKVKNKKYEGQEETDDPWTSETRKMMKSLGKLAFEQLLKGNLIFSQIDLRKCGLDSEDIAQSGVFAQVFREQPGQGLKKVYCFIHLSVQEFLAALHVHETFYSSGENLLSPPRSSENTHPTPEETLQSPKRSRLDTDDSDPTPEETFYCSAVDQALQSPNGHLDLFLRFLLGLSLPTNQRLLEGLLTTTGSDQTNQRTVKYIKEKLDEEGVSAERSLNLLHCLNELNDRSLVEQIQKVMREGRLSNRIMSRAEWSALSFLLLSSDSDLEHFDLRKYCPSEKALLGLLPVVKASSKVTLSGSGLTSDCCGPDGPLASVLSSSSLTLLDLSRNNLQDSGVKLLCEGLKSAPCRLDTLSLSLCGLTSRCCGPPASVLSSSSLTLLDLSNNNLQDSGVELLCEGLKSAPCRLDTLRLSGCMVTERGGASLAATLSSALFSLRELDLRYNHPGSSREKLTALQASQRPLQTLREARYSGTNKDAQSEAFMDRKKCRRAEFFHKYLENQDQTITAGFSSDEALEQAPPLRVRYWSWSCSGPGLVQFSLVFCSRLDPAGEKFMVPGLRKYACEFSLDRNTVQKYLLLSEDLRSVTRVKRKEPQSYPDHNDRFTDEPQVLSSSGLRGRCYWEVDWNVEECGFVYIAVSYRGISRRGGESVFGFNDQSWSLEIIEEGERYVWHKNNITRLPSEVDVSSGRVGVFLDWEDGALSFYDVTDGGLSHLHTITTSFTEELFPGFRLRSTGSSVTVVDLTS